MKSQSILFKSLGVGLLAILCFLLFNISDGIFGRIVFEAGDYHSFIDVVSFSDVVFTILPFMILLVFFVFLWNDNKDNKFAKYALWTALIAVLAIALSNLLEYVIQQKWLALERMQSNYHYDYDHEGNSKILENKRETIELLLHLKSYVSAAILLIVVAFFFTVDVVKKNSKLLWSVIFVVIAILLEEFYTVQHYYSDTSYLEYVENTFIYHMILTTLQVASIANLFFVYAQKDQPQDEDKKFTSVEWLAVAGALVTMIFFFCNWMDCEKIFGKDSSEYVTLGCHVVPFAAMGLAVIAGAVISVFMRSNVAKQISCIGMMAWPLVVCIATWIFDVHDGYTVGEIIQEANEDDGFLKDFMKMINPISIIGYTVCSIGTGMLILKTLPKKVEDEFVPKPPVFSKDDEIARLRAEIEALREKSQDPQN
jgi:hypothetical protein